MNAKQLAVWIILSAITTVLAVVLGESPIGEQTWGGDANLEVIQMPGEYLVSRSQHPTDSSVLLLTIPHERTG